MTLAASAGVSRPEVEMLLAMWAFLAGCVVPYEHDCDSGDSGLDAPAGWNHGCSSNDECEGAYACGDWRDDSVDSRTDAYGCFERCIYDVECKGGYRCDSYGACVSGP